MTPKERANLIIGKGGQALLPMHDDENKERSRERPIEQGRLVIGWEVVKETHQFSVTFPDRLALRDEIAKAIEDAVAEATTLRPEPGRGT